MFPPWRIEGSLAGIDPVYVIVMVGAAAAAIVVTTVIARNLQQLQPKTPAPSQVQKASAEFDAWTERPKDQASKDQEYYSLYGSQPGRPAIAPARPMAAPPPPVNPMTPVMIDLSGSAPAPAERGWMGMPEERGPVSAPMHPPARPEPGPSDEVIAPTHGRRVRDTATGELPPRSGERPAFERLSFEGGAVAPTPMPTPQAPPVRSSPPPPLPQAPPSPPPPPQLKSAQVAEGLPEGVAVNAAARAAFRGPSRGQTVVGAGATGVQEGQVLSAATKSIRCPKCQTVFVGPAARPATVKCPACGTTGTLK